MNFGQSSPLGIASQVWAATTRKLTSLAPGMVQNSNANNSLAAASAANLAPGAGPTVSLAVAGKAGAAGTLQIGLSDAVQQFPGVTIAAGQFGVLGGLYSTSVVWTYLKNNDAVNAATYSFAGITIS